MYCVHREMPVEADACMACGHHSWLLGRSSDLPSSPPPCQPATHPCRCCPQDNGTEHPHRVCISTRADVTSTVMRELERSVAGRGLQVGRAAGGQRCGA